MFITTGQTAPDFTLKDQDGQPLTLSSLHGAPVLIYFYPKDETPGCTTQAQGIRDEWDAFEQRKVIVLGISPDGIESHRAFCNNHGLPHTLLSDPEHEVMEAYGAWGEKVLYGKTSIGVIRSSVLLDADGTVVKVWKRAQAKTHAERALKAVDDLLVE